MHPNSPALTRRDAVRFLGLAGFAALLPSIADRAQAAEALPTTAAPSLAGEQAGYFRFKIGELEAVAINDGGFGGPLDQAPWPGGDRAKLNADLAEAFLPPDRFGIPINVLLVRLGSELVLVDAGCGSLFGPTNGKLRARLAAIGVQPEHITAVILTHTHADHFGGLFEGESGMPVFARAQHFIHRREFEFWTGALAGTPVSIAKADSAANAQRALQALKGKWQLVAPGDKLIDGLEIIDAPGHTPGHIALEFASGQDRLLHVVDIAHHHVISFANPELPIAFDVQTPEAIATRRKLLDRAAADRARIFGTHLPFPCLGHVRRRGAAYEHVLEPTPAA